MKKRIFLTVCFVGLIIMISCHSDNSEGKEIIRQPVVAGSWYPGDKEELRNTVDYLLKKAQKHELKGELIVLMAPHAGFTASGEGAAETFKQIEGHDFKTVIIIGPSHAYPLKGISVFEHGYFATPLGKVKINESIAGSLISENRIIKSIPEAHREEHCIEIELPFLQRLLKNFEIVPILAGHMSLEECESAAETLAKHITPGETLLVVSSDMSHYPAYENANRVDKEMLEVIKTLNPRKIFSTSRAILDKNIPGLLCTLCGENSVLIAVSAARKLKANCVTIMRYYNSGDLPGSRADTSGVVGYGSVAITRYPSVSKKAQEELLKLAREAIETYIEKGKLLEVKNTLPELSRKFGLFVTLRQGKNLRGCIGQVEHPDALSAIIARLACSAAFGDPRFPQLTKEELGKITIEVTVCSPLRKISNPEEIIPSLNGVVVRRGAMSGLFLPSVWDETGWAKEKFMNYLCAEKAGLPQDAWKDKGTDIYIFTGFDFSE